MPSLHQHPRLLVLRSFAEGTLSLLSVLPLLSGVDSVRHHQSFLLFPMDEGPAVAKIPVPVPDTLIRSPYSSYSGLIIWSCGSNSQRSSLETSYWTVPNDITSPLNFEVRFMGTVPTVGHAQLIDE
jgi:hypothetical protein